MKLLLVIMVLAGVWLVSGAGMASLQAQQPPANNSAAPSIDKDEKIQAAFERYLKEEGHANRGPWFFDLATNLPAGRKPPIPEKAIIRYFGKPELVGYTGTKDARGKWTEKTTIYAYAVDNKNNRAVAKDSAGEKITVLVAVRDDHLISVAFIDGVIKESPGWWEKYNK